MTDTKRIRLADYLEGDARFDDADGAEHNAQAKREAAALLRQTVTALAKLNNALSPTASAEIPMHIHQKVNEAILAAYDTETGAS